VSVVCKAHRFGVTGRRRPAEDVQAELLAAYGVDLLPSEGAAGELRPRVTVPGTKMRVPAAPVAAAHSLAQCAVRVTLFLIKTAFWLIAIGFVLSIGAALLGGLVGRTSGGPGPVVSPSASPPVTRVLSSSPTEDDEALRTVWQEPKPRVVLFAAVCGSGHWDHIRIVRCSLPSAHLFGFASLATPSGPEQDCFGSWAAYTRGHHFWICWTDFLGRAQLTPWARAPNPWSIPPARGGATR
jgi:hypothetical protein